MKQFKLILILSLALLSQLQAQFPIETRVILVPPYPTNIDAYSDYLGQNIVELTNTSSTPVEAYFQATIEEETGKLSIGTNGILTDPVMIEPGTKILSPFEVQDLFEGIKGDDLVVGGLSPEEQQAILLNRQIPEGNYRICLRAYDLNGQPLSDPSADACTQIDITFPERPIIDLPLDESEILNNGFVNITWSHNISNIDALTRTEYILKIVDLTEQNIETKQLAMLDPAVSPEYEEEVGPVKSVLIQQDIEMPLLKGHKYACRVTAVDPLDEISYQFGGHSEIIVFTYGEEGEEEEAALGLPVILTPLADEFLAGNAGIALSWEHEVEDELIADDTKYTLRVIDMDSVKLTSISQEEFYDEQVYIYDIPIQANDTTLVSSTLHPLVKDRKYAIAIKADRVNDDRVEYPNDGYSEIITFIYGEEPEEEADECAGDCITTLPVNKTESPIKKRDRLFMGKFTLVVDDVVKDAQQGGYKGKGYVIMKFMGGMKVNVSFSGLRANKGKFVFAGEATADYDTSLPKLDGLAAAGLSSATGLDMDKAGAISTAIRNTGKIASALAGKQTNLPLGFDRDVQGEKMIVGITEMTFTAESAELGALFSLENPDWGQYVPSFGANEICFTQDGFSKGFKLYLAKDFNIPIDPDAPIILKGVDSEDPEALGTFVEVDCNGFKRGQITAVVPVPREVLVPEDEDGKIADSGNATIQLSGTFAKAGNFLLAASMKPCQIPGLEGFTLELENGHYDSSDDENPAGIAFPQGYTRAETDKTWKGVWFSNVSIKAPNDWLASSDEERTAFTLANFVKDDVGVSLKGTIDNILSIEKGEIEGFAVSIDQLSLDIIRNQFKEVKMTGRMGLPILPEDTYLTYEGIVDREQADEPTGNQTAGNQTVTQPKPGQPAKKEALQMAFTVKPDKDGYDIEWLKSHIDFEENSQIILKNDSKQRGVSANLSGSITIKSSIGAANDARETGTPEIEIPGIKFEGMEMSRMIEKVPATGTPAAGASNPNTGKNATGGFVFKTGTMSFVGLDVANLTGNTNQKPGVTPTAGATPETKPEEEEEDEVVDPKMNGFAISIDEISFGFGEGDNSEEKEIKDGSAISLTVVPAVMLVGGQKKAGAKPAAGASPKPKAKKEGFSISAEGKFVINGRVNKKQGGSGYSFGYESLDVKGFAVESEVGPIGIKGGIEFYTNDETFGNGMVGELQVTMPVVDVKLEARFGNTLDAQGDLDYAYWYLFGDLMITAPTGLVKVGPYFTLHGFNGGVYYHMEDKNPTAESARERYTPSKNVSLGVKAGITFAVTDAKVLWANTTFGVEFDENYGLKKISLDGDAYLMQPTMGKVPGSEVDGIKIALRAAINFKSDEVDNKGITFDASADVYVNLAGGIIYGNMKDRPNQMVAATMHVSSSAFKMLMGRPSDPGFLRAEIPDVLSVDARGYFMAGKDIPFETQELHPFIKDLLGRTTEDMSGAKTTDTGPSERNTSNGDGVAMGINIDYNLNIKAAILYADLRAMFGFDLMMRDYPGVVCANNGNQPIGLNGFYATGQVFAGLSGDMGLDIDLFFYTGKLSIAKMQAVLLLEGGLPNPMWVRGTARMSYSVLGGMVEGSTGFTVQLGEECEKQVIDPFAGVDIISDIDPGNNTTNVSVFAKPQVSLNAKLGTYEVPVVTDGVRTVKKFRLRIEKYELKEGGRVVSTNRKQENDTKILLEPKAMLKSQAEHTVSITLKADEMISGSWKPYKKDGKVWEVLDSRTFKVGDPPKVVTWKNVKLTYPFREEENYLHGENQYKEGFLQFGVPVNYLFKDEKPADNQWHSRIKVKYYRYTPNKTTYFAESEPMQKTGSFFTFKMPQTLDNNIYVQCRIVREYYQNPSWDLTGRKNDAVAVASTSSNYQINIEGETYQNYSSKKPEDMQLFAFEFGTSKYTDFRAKMASGNKTMEVRDEYNSGTRQYGRTFDYLLNSDENFSYEELGVRRIQESNSRVGGMLEINENYRTAFYTKVFDFFEYERTVMAWTKDLSKPEVVGQLIAAGKGQLFTQTVINKSNFKVSIDDWPPISVDDRQLGFRTRHNLISAKSDNNGSFTLYSDVLYYGDMDAKRTAAYGGALAAIVDDVEWKVKFINGNAVHISPVDKRVNATPPRGNYEVKMRYWTPRVVNGRIKEINRGLVKLNFKY